MRGSVRPYALRKSPKTDNMSPENNDFCTEVNLSNEIELLVTGKFVYSQYRNKEENAEGTEDLFLY